MRPIILNLLPGAHIKFASESSAIIQTVAMSQNQTVVSPWGLIIASDSALAFVYSTVWNYSVWEQYTVHLLHCSHRVNDIGLYKCKAAKLIKQKNYSERLRKSMHSALSSVNTVPALVLFIDWCLAWNSTGDLSLDVSCNVVLSRIVFSFPNRLRMSQFFVWALLVM